ncbi:phosphotransferase [Oryctes borbonicus]|uniref:Phosphotransferase n=1 Tax=Oryctes borbonicus TaxID=1629725 RepID=A0A0T6ATS9_9SCAR|nr:phosphotransferase [Oryctes borbonicus]
MTIDLPLCTEDVNNTLQDIVSTQGFSKPEIVFLTGSNIGQGYLSVDTAVKITEADRELNLFIKTAPKHKSIREVFQIRTAYLNELRFYENIYPELDKFYLEKTSKPLNIAPKFYSGNNEENKEVIALENLKAEGFNVPPAKKVLEKEEVVTLMRTYAKLHGTSLALRDQKQDLFDDITKDIPDFFYGLFKTAIQDNDLMGVYGILERNLEKTPDNEMILEKFKYLVDNMHETLVKIKDFHGDYRVITHGDCNCNNLMFRNKEELRLIDYQGMKLASPALDLSYVFYATSTSEDNFIQLDYFLDQYYEALSATVIELGSNPQALFPKELIKEDWKTFCGFSVAMAVYTAISMFCEGGAPNIVDLIVNPPTTEDDNRYVINEDECTKWTTCLFKHLISNGFL